jgi:segregation and condensation protein B
MTYGTTNDFLEYFGIKHLDDLPAADELRRIVVQKPESLLTVDPGLATAPPEQLKLEESSAQTAVTTTPQDQSSSTDAAAEAEPASKNRFAAQATKGEDS